MFGNFCFSFQKIAATLDKLKLRFCCRSVYFQSGEFQTGASVSRTGAINGNASLIETFSHYDLEEILREPLKKVSQEKFPNLWNSKAEYMYIFNTPTSLVISFGLQPRMGSEMSCLKKDTLL